MARKIMFLVKAITMSMASMNQVSSPFVRPIPGAHLQLSVFSADTQQSSSIADPTACDQAHERFEYIQIRSRFEYDTYLRYLGMDVCKDTGWISALLLL